MSKGANVYWTIEQIKAYMSVQLHRGKEYPTDFLAGIFTVILDQVLTILIISIAFSNVQSLGGWTIYESIVLYGFSRISFGVADSICEKFWMIRTLARSGELMLMKTHPQSVFMQVVMDGWHLERLFSVASGIAFIVYGLINLGAPVPLYLLLLALLLSIVGSQAVIFVLTLTGAVTINTLGAGIMQNGWSLIEFSKYTTNIFLQPFRFLFLRLIPLALMGYLPAGLIFGKVTAVDILASLLGLWFFGFVSLKYWNRSIKAYEGVGA